jgi:hypothetical protein
MDGGCMNMPITAQYRWNIAKVGIEHQPINQSIQTDITAQYSWNIAKVGIEHQPIKQS